MWALGGKIRPLVLNSPITFVPGSVCCSSALCLFFVFKLDIIIYLKVHYPTSTFKITHNLDNIGNSRFIPITSKQSMTQASARLNVHQYEITFFQFCGQNTHFFSSVYISSFILLDMTFRMSYYTTLYATFDFLNNTTDL